MWIQLETFSFSWYQWSQCSSLTCKSSLIKELDFANLEHSGMPVLEGYIAVIKLSFVHKILTSYFIFNLKCKCFPITHTGISTQTDVFVYQLSRLNGIVMKEQHAHESEYSILVGREEEQFLKSDCHVSSFRFSKVHRDQYLFCY